MIRTWLVAGCVALLLSFLPLSSRGDGDTRCLKRSGNEGARCLERYARSVAACRKQPDAACEAALRAEGGTLEQLLGQGDTTINKNCTLESANVLGYLTVDDVQARVPEACADFAEDFLDVAYADDLALLLPEELRCQSSLAKALSRLRKRVVKEHGIVCYLKSFSGKGCDRARRDQRVAKRRAKLRDKILRSCNPELDTLGLMNDPNATIEEQVDVLLDLTITRARHFALRVYPPNDLGPTSDFGPFPVGVQTLALADPNRLNVPGDGPRPVTVEVYYPSTETAVAGLMGDIVDVLGIPVIETPAFRDVAIAPGPFPLVLFSHGNNGIRFQSFFFTAHLASYGFVVVAPDHHGNTFLDVGLGVIDGASAINRPLDMSFLIDSFLAFNTEPGNFFEGAIDPSRIGMSGHSFGGYTTFALAGGSFGLGTFTDPRIKAFFPQAPSAFAFSDAFFGTITAPTLIVGGTLDETTPFDSDQQRPFDNLLPGATVAGLAALENGGHFTFSDFCEVPRELLAFLGGFDEACEPRHLPWRHSHDIVNYLSLNFFDGVLNGNADALDRLDPVQLVTIENLVYQSK